MALFFHTYLSLSSAKTPPPGKLLIAGGHRLSGHAVVSGSKNSSLAILAATLCCSSGSSLIRPVPNVSDTDAMFSILRALGARVEVSEEAEDGMVVEVDAGVGMGGVGVREACGEVVKGIRAGFFVVGPLVARFGEAMVDFPGGCRIGERPVEIHLRGLEALGAVVDLRNGKVHVHAANRRGLVGGSFRLDYPSVGATETLMMAASIADGVTVLSNVAREPEVVDLANFLIASGAGIEGAGTGRLAIVGKKQLLHGVDFTIIPDRIEAGTLMAAAAITQSCISLSPVIPDHLISVIKKLSTAGCIVTHTGKDTLQVSAVPEKTLGCLHGFNFKTLPYPGFPTDLQPQFMALLTTCKGTSIVEETVFEGRMDHAMELRKLGARIQVCGNAALVGGKYQGSTLSGSRVVATNLRGGASLVIAGMAAEGITEVTGITHIDRGYEGLELKLKGLGANIIRVSD